MNLIVPSKALESNLSLTICYFATGPSVSPKKEILKVGQNLLGCASFCLFSTWFYNSFAGSDLTLHQSHNKRLTFSRY